VKNANPRLTAVMIGIVGVLLVGLVIYVVATGAADPLFLVGVVAVVVIGAVVFARRARR
jgi:Co/Zn/Cd efflux system component